MKLYCSTSHTPSCGEESQVMCIEKGNPQPLRNALVTPQKSGYRNIFIL